MLRMADGPVANLPSGLDAYVPLFLAKVQESDDCWEWVGFRDRLGYGRYQSWKGENYAHRVSYRIFVGPIPDGMSLDHLCRNRGCVRPDHLEPVLHRVNVLRGDGPTAVNAAKTRCVQGHELSGDNLIIRKKGYRECRECGRRRMREYDKRRRSRAA